MARARTFAVGRRKGPMVSVWLARSGAADPRDRDEADRPLPWRVAAVVRGPVRTPAPAPGVQPGDAARSLSSASIPAADEMARCASATPSPRVGAFPAT